MTAKYVTDIETTKSIRAAGDILAKHVYDAMIEQQAAN